MAQNTRLRSILTRTVAGLLSVAGAVSFVTRPSRFFDSFRHDWPIAIGVWFVLIAFAAYAVFGERRSYKVLGAWGKTRSLPDTLVDRAVRRGVEIPPELGGEETPPGAPPNDRRGTEPGNE